MIKVLLLKLACWIIGHYNAVAIENGKTIYYQGHYFEITETVLSVSVCHSPILELKAMGKQAQLGEKQMRIMGDEGGGQL